MRLKAMSGNDWHISDEDLVLAADGELKEHRSAQIRRHLRTCWKCRTRMARIESAVVDFVEASRHEEPELPPIAGPRALLRSNLAAMSSARTKSPWWQRLFAQHALAYSLAVLIAVLAGGEVLRLRMATHSTHDSLDVSSAGALPDPKFTPGATRPISLAEACSSDYGEVVTPVSREEQVEVFAEYGMTGAPIEDYEVDHLITPDLGGSDDIRNLWPEPHNDTRWNSYAKDRLEDRLHRLVCSGKLSLTVAQQDISNNWIDAYQKYLQSDLPVPEDPTPQSR
jgi:hypothetical protein